MKFAYILFLLFLMPVCFHGQTATLKKIERRSRFIRKATKIDPEKPAVYIDFVKIGPADPRYSDESKEGVYLRLVNNSKWSIYVPRIFYGEDQKKTGFRYSVEEEVVGASVKEIPTGVGQNSALDIGYGDTELKAGRSVDFSIPRNHLAPNLLIRIYFDFEWELAFDGPVQTEILYHNVDTSVIFRSADLEKILEKRKSK